MINRMVPYEGLAEEVADSSAFLPQTKPPTLAGKSSPSTVE
jgi:hypothetical protein